MVEILKVGVAVAVLFLGIQVGRDMAHKFVTPTPTA